MSPESSACARTTTGRRRPGIETHFRAIAASTDLPIVLYDIPARTGRKIASATLVRLANDVPNIVALKDAAGNPGATAAVTANEPRRLRDLLAATTR